MGATKGGGLNILNPLFFLHFWKIGNILILFILEINTISPVFKISTIYPQLWFIEDVFVDFAHFARVYHKFNKNRYLFIAANFSNIILIFYLKFWILGNFASFENSEKNSIYWRFLRFWKEWDFEFLGIFEFFDIFDIFDIFNFLRFLMMLMMMLMMSMMMILVIPSSNYVENCLCPKWLLPEWVSQWVSQSVTTLGIELLSQLKKVCPLFSDFLLISLILKNSLFPFSCQSTDILR